MAASNAIGTGALILSANADGLVAGLKKAEKSTDAWAKGVTSRTNAVMSGIGAGFIGGSLAGVTTAAVGAIVTDVMRAASGVDRLSESLAASTQYVQRLTANFDRMSTQADQFISAAVTPGDQFARLYDEVERLRPIVQSLKGDWQGANAEVQRLDEKDLGGLADYFLFQSGEKLKYATDRADLFADAINKINRRAEQLAQNMAKVQGAFTSDQISGRLKELNDEIVSNLQGFNDIERELFRWEQRGASVKDLGELERRLREAEAARMTRLREQGITEGSGSLAVGLSAALKSVEVGLANLGEQADNLARPLFSGVMERGSAAAYSLDVANRFGTETTDAAQLQREQLEQERRTTRAIERVNQGIDRLNQMLGESV